MRGRRGRRGRRSDRMPEREGAPHRVGHEPRAVRSRPGAAPAAASPDDGPAAPAATAPASAAPPAQRPGKHQPPGAAVLVDGDNVPPEVVPLVLDLAAQGGPVTERRVYRNWRSTKHAGQWDQVTKRHAFERMDRYATAKGKNSSDVALVVGAVDLYHAGVRRFFIVSGDTDFSPLVDRLRRGGGQVTIVGHNVAGGLLEEIADAYLDWRRLGKAPKTPQGAAKQASPRGRAPASPKAAAQRPAPPRPPAGPGATKGQARSAGRPAPAAAPAKGTAPARGAPARGPAPATGAVPPSAAARGLLEQVLLDAYEVARTDGELDAQGFVTVSRLGQIARTVDARFGPALYGLPTRTPMYRLFAAFPQRFEVEPVGDGRRPQYRVRRRDGL